MHVPSDQWYIYRKNNNNNNDIQVLNIFPIVIQDQTWLLLGIVRSTFFSLYVFKRKIQKHKYKHGFENIEVTPPSVQKVFQVIISNPEKGNKTLK